MYELKQMVSMDVKNLIKNPIWVGYATLFPLLLVGILSFLSDSSADSQLRAVDYFGITILLFSALQGSSFSANAFLEERIKQPNMRLIMMPVPAWFIPFSKIIATFLFTVLFNTINGLILYLIFSVNFGGKHWFAVWLFLAMIDLLAVVIGVLFCTMFKSESIANQITSLVTQVLALMSGCFFPIYVFGDKIAFISSYSPLTKGIHSLFEVIYDGDFQHYFTSLFSVLVIAILGCLCSLLLFKGEDYL